MNFYPTADSPQTKSWLAGFILWGKNKQIISKHNSSAKKIKMLSVMFY